MIACWAKINAFLPKDPRCDAAGFWGTTAYLHLLLLNKAHNCAGLVPHELSSARYLARYTLLTEASDIGERLMSEGLAKAQLAGLIAHAPKGIEIVGWDKSWDRLSDLSTPRTRKWRERNKNETNGNGSERSGNEGTDGNKTETTGSNQSDNATLEPKKSLDPAKISANAHRLSKKLADMVVANAPGGKLAKLAPAVRAKRELKWADELRIAHEQDKHSWEAIEDMIAWALEDTFWSGVISSPTGLRRNWDQISISQRKGKRTADDDVRFGRVEPHPHDSYPRGEVKL